MLVNSARSAPFRSIAAGKSLIPIADILTVEPN
jgi:hypothetical protein